PPLRVWQVTPAAARPQAPAWVVGRLVHAALANWRFPGAGFGDWLAGRARALGLTDAARLADAVRQAERLLTRLQGHALYAEATAAERRLHEVAYSRAEAERVEVGVIDLLYRSAGGWSLVEFKSDHLRAGVGVETWLEEMGHRAQAGRYAAAVEALLGQRPRALICLLDWGGAVRLQEV
ncbi:MAG: PD-(D/E)XK nuclease family protein, partial [Candidatus Promineifilaceae bacterium]